MTANILFDLLDMVDALVVRFTTTIFKIDGMCSLSFKYATTDYFTTDYHICWCYKLMKNWRNSITEDKGTKAVSLKTDRLVHQLLWIGIYNLRKGFLSSLITDSAQQANIS